MERSVVFENFLIIFKSVAPIPPSDIEYEASISGMEGFYELPYADTVTLEVYKSGDAYRWSINKNDGAGFVEIEDAMDKTYTLPTLEAAADALVCEALLSYGQPFILKDRLIPKVWITYDSLLYIANTCKMLNSAVY